MEAHEQVIGLVAVDRLPGGLEHVIGHGVVDVQQGRREHRGAGGHVFAQGAVDVHFAGDGDAARGHARIDVAGDEAEIRFVGRPAFVGEDRVLGGAQVGLHELGQGHFILGQLVEQGRIAAARAQLLGHVGGHGRNLGRALGLEEKVIEVELGILHDFHTQVIERLDRGVAGQEVLRPRPEAEDLQPLQTEQDAGRGDEFADHRGDFVGHADRIIRDVRPQLAQADVVGGVEHAAIGIAASVDEIFSCLLGGGREHDRAVEALGQDGRRPFGAEVAQEDDQGVDAGRLDFVQGLEGVLLVFDDGRDFDDRNRFLAAFFGHADAALAGQLDGEAVAADADEAELDGRNVVHEVSFFCP